MKSLEVGLYGVALGKIFFGESMFAAVSDSSKIAFVFLARQLKKWDFDLIDCQIKNDHLIRLGAKEITREEFAKRLAANIEKPSKTGKWHFHLESSDMYNV